MPKQQYQVDFLQFETSVLELDDADINYQSGFIEHAAALSLYQTLLEQTQWRQEVITVYGKQHPTPRLSCWMGNSDLDYGYSHIRMQPVKWSKTLLKVKQQIEHAADATFNSVLVNYYRDGQDSNGWHSDDEPELGKNPIIASLSLGAPRDFHLRHKQKNLKHKITLENGSLLMMRGPTQHFWQHHIPKRAHALGRINLTFRTIKTKTG